MYEKLATLMFCTTLLLSVALSIYVIVTPTQGERFTEFYILGPGKRAYNYPTNLRLGKNGTVIVGVVNHEHRAINYTLKIQLANVTLLTKEIQLDHNETFQERLKVFPIKKGKGRMEFLLLRGNSTPYRSLYLWLDVS